MFMSAVSALINITPKTDINHFNSQSYLRSYTRMDMYSTVQHVQYSATQHVQCNTTLYLTNTHYEFQLYPAILVNSGHFHLTSKHTKHTAFIH